MRQSKRQVTSPDELIKILEHGQVCRLALQDGAYPYIVAMNYGYEMGENLTLYFHCAHEGKKIDLIKKNPRAGFQLEGDTKLVAGEHPCQYTTCFESIVGSGEIEIIEDERERIRGLDLLMRHHGWTGKLEYLPKSLALASVLKLTAREYTGKRYWK
ncbi:pyridoxamine 5'-phosphate oxidase family protein [Candidatus Soleaferrea massiliensis]|uniref:pyridoxamine 5'-phosphate oxidase family protein n=1 Tax=Candidatus Soleaferrea massiliensis TaxID=1470354 RepID=UPI00059082B4|nr:pyridoxamine 5'-phosphate oxidase family protein [Candidatus Soleaferrea massiliensis]